MTKQTVLLLFGGESSEHEISIRSAENVYKALDRERFEIILGFIAKDGTQWSVVPSFENLSGPTISANMGQRSFSVDGTKLSVDVLLPILHGENGHEDGAVQGLAQLLHIPVVGCGVGSSAVCWDKLYTKQLLSENQIAVSPYILYQKTGDAVAYSDVIDKLGTVVFVKPTIAGSSVGVSKVHNEAEFQPAIDEALKHSDNVLIETSIEGRELEIAVLGNPPNHIESGVGEIIPGEEFYSYDDKYSDNSTAQVLTNANLSAELVQEIKTTAHRAYEVLGCKGLARVDFLLDHDNNLFLNEFNTMPGFTSISQYPKLWAETGMSQTELLSRLIDLSLSE